MKTLIKIIPRIINEIAATAIVIAVLRSITITITIAMETAATTKNLITTMTSRIITETILAILVQIQIIAMGRAVIMVNHRTIVITMKATQAVAVVTAVVITMDQTIAI